jgi:hypothetical protein
MGRALEHVLAASDSLVARIELLDRRVAALETENHELRSSLQVLTLEQARRARVTGHMARRHLGELADDETAEDPETTGPH